MALQATTAIAAILERKTEMPNGQDPVIRAPAGLGMVLLLLVGAIVGGCLYLVAVRGEALFVDLAALSGMLFCY